MSSINALTLIRFTSEVLNMASHEVRAMSVSGRTVVLAQALVLFLQAKQLSGFSEKTIRAYAHDLRSFFKWIEGAALRQITWEDFNRGEISAWCATKKLSTATIARRVSTLKSFCKWAFEERLITVNPLAALETPRVRSKPPKYLTKKEYAYLLSVVRKFDKDKAILPGRDYAILVLFVSTGLRISELMNIAITDVNLSDETMLILRKGGNRQVLPIPKIAIRALRRWIRYRARFCQNVALLSDALFISNHRRPMNAETIRNLCKKWFEVAGLSQKQLSPHSLRHTFGTAQINIGTPIHVVKELLGHSSIESTMRYLHTRRDDLRRAVNKMKL